MILTPSIAASGDLALLVFPPMKVSSSGSGEALSPSQGRGPVWAGGEPQIEARRTIRSGGQRVQGYG